MVYIAFNQYFTITQYIPVYFSVYCRAGIQIFEKYVLSTVLIIGRLIKLSPDLYCVKNLVEQFFASWSYRENLFKITCSMLSALGVMKCLRLFEKIH